MSRSLYWCFTINNYNEEEVQTLQALGDAAQDISYLVFGREVGANGTRHLQGYVEFPRRLRIAQVKRLIGERAHLETRRGNSNQAADYCKKDGEFTEYGQLSVSRQGARVDLEELHESLRQKRTLAEISDDHFGQFLRYERSIRSYRFIHSVARDPDIPPAVVVYWGRTGTGKTRSVWLNASSPDDVWVYPGKGWFDGFDGQPIALFDDFRGSSMELHLLLQVLDRYPLKVRIKGSHVNWNPAEIYLTSNISPDEWYPHVDQASRDALLRRFTNVVEFQ